MQAMQALHRRAAVRVERIEPSPFLDWAKRAAARHTRSAATSQQDEVCTRAMALRQQFLADLDSDGEAGQDAFGAVKRRPIQCVRHGHVPFPFANPNKLVWRSDLLAGSYSVQEQVNYSLATAKHLQAAEVLIRPRCKVAV